MQIGEEAVTAASLNLRPVEGVRHWELPTWEGAT